MSRCFPFPPPGYEKKTRPENHDLLKKEKHKEKKHKKEKRDREKREGKREKDRSDEKRREKRDKKEKHRDKKKDREKNRDKEKNNHAISGEKKILGQGDAYKGERYDEQRRDRGSDKNAVLFEKNSKLVHESGNKVAIQEEKRRNVERRKDGGTPKMGVTSPPTPLASSERSKERKLIDEKKHRHDPEEAQYASARKLSGFQAVGVSRSMEKNAEWKKNINEKITVKEVDDERGERREDENKEKPNREKLVELSRAQDSNKVHPSELKSKDLTENDPSKAQGSRIADVPENLRKRKEFGRNGVSCEDDNGPKTRARIASLSHPTAQNGRTPHSSRKSNGTQSASRICQASSMAADQNPKKPPHPDMKYLAQILSVPKIEDWSEIDDQDWLFFSRRNKPKAEIVFGADSRQVWAEALRIEPAELFALPYVVPR